MIEFDKEKVAVLKKQSSKRKAIHFSVSNYNKIKEVKKREKIFLSDIINYLLFLYNKDEIDVEVEGKRDWEEETKSTTLYVNEEVMKNSNIKMLEKGQINFIDLVNKLVEDYL